MNIRDVARDDHYRVVDQPIPALAPAMTWNWCVSDGQIILVRCGSKALATRICAMMNRDLKAAAVPCGPRRAAPTGDRDHARSDQSGGYGR